MKRLKDPQGPISLFLERATRLGDELLGPILVQVIMKLSIHMKTRACIYPSIFLLFPFCFNVCPVG